MKGHIVHKFEKDKGYKKRFNRMDVPGGFARWRPET